LDGTTFAESLFHDSGKGGTPEEILNKPAKLTDPEYKMVQSHPLKGHQVLSLSKVKAKAKAKANKVALDVCPHHQEKFDGSGYPDKLAGHTISTYSEMDAICDVYDAITTNRCYKQGWGPC
jgi:HD-GYP domain-containing protein (c-di-GMP phosphodiesterase class II)